VFIFECVGSQSATTNKCNFKSKTKAKEYSSRSMYLFISA